MSLNCRDIVECYLRSEGYAGLYNPDVSCGCSCIDLMPCSMPVDRCKAGFIHYCNECPNAREGHEGDCPVDDGPTRSFCVGPTEDFPEVQEGYRW